VNGRAILVVLAFMVTLFTDAPAFSHSLAPALLDVTELGNGRAEIVWRQSSRQLAGPRLEPRFPPQCAPATPIATAQVEGSVVRRWLVDCGAPLAGTRIGIDNLARSPSAVLLILRTADGETIRRVLHAEQPDVVVPARASSVDVLRDYGMLGIEHILSGVDHLLFVAGLLLLVRNLRPLVWTITSFTVGHSVSLAAATLGWVSVPTRPLEAAVALSIVFVAVEILHQRRGRAGIGAKWPWLVAFAFGLVHGLAFAGALTEAGLPSHAIPLSLLSFNLGVEAGQLAFVVSVLALFGALRVLRVRWPHWSAAAAAYAIGSIALVWFADRTSWLLTG
jgi:hypothetical protein